MSSGNGQKPLDLPRGLIGRRGTPTGRGARLPSIRGPRDLTLGGIPKKVFTPNIPVRREKEKEQPKVEESQKKEKRGKNSEKRDGKTERGRGQGRGRGRGRGQDIIQSHSIFEQGPSERLGSRGGGGFSDYGGGGGGGSGGGGSRTSFSSSGVKIKHEKPDDGSKQVLDFLLRDDFIDDGGSDDLMMRPVQLPLCARSVGHITTKPDIKDVKIKDDPDGDSKMEEERKPNKSEPSSFSVGREETCQDLFTNSGKSEMGELLFFQFPDTMPGVPPSRDDSDKTKSKPDNTAKPEDELSKKMGTCSLSDFSEGYMGKLIVRKSGRTQLVLGNITLDVAMGTRCGFLQDLVSVEVDEKSGDNGDMTVLGHVNQRLVCTPDFDSLLQTL